MEGCGYGMLGYMYVCTRYGPRVALTQVQKSGLFGLPCFAIAVVIAYVRAFLHRVLSSSW